MLNDCEITSCVGDAVCKLCKTGRVEIKTENKQIGVSLRDPSLCKALNGLNINSLSMDNPCKAFRENHKESLTQTLVLLLQLDKLSIEVKHSIPQSPDQWKTLHGLNIRSLSLNSDRELKHIESLSQSLASLTRLEMLSIKVYSEEPGMWEAFHGLGIKSLSLSMSGRSTGFKLKYAESLKQSILSLKQLETLSLSVDADSTGLWEALHGLNIKRLSLSLGGETRGYWVDHAESSQSLKQSLSSLTQLDTLSISVEYYSPDNRDSPSLGGSPWSEYQESESDWALFMF
ncbi:hypothetical protein DPMN_057526 [Dreissena polymorpha]|uniref:Uncharacterized protein n=1 Tax=Dreissena polymorpha TaxID=45954 RepID=A0A9D4C092_DREPO|nr:hypothetical protein DPMN_057526 [Dreissena polymorpha]